jgi:two-component system, NtrC family, sensor kinase
MTTDSPDQLLDSTISLLFEKDIDLNSTDKQTLETVKILAKHKRDSIIDAKINYLEGIINLNNSEIDRAIKLFTNALNLFRKEGKTTYEIDTLAILGWCIGYIKSDFNKGIEYLNRAKEMAEKLDLKDKMSVIYNRIGVILFSQGILTIALEYHFKSLKLKQDLNNLKGLASSYNNIGVVFNSLENYEQALKYFKLGLNIDEQTGDETGMAHIYGNIGNALSALENYDEALNNYQKSYEIRKKYDDKLALANSLFNIGKCKRKMNDTSEATKFIRESLQIANELGSKELLAIIQLQIATNLIDDKKYDRAKDLLLITLDYAKEIDVRKLFKDILEQLYICFKATGNITKALFYHEKMVIAEKEIFNEASTRKITALQYSAEIEQKARETEIERLKNVELKKAYEDLKQAQNELIKKERMAAIGKIASEIAHEVQNPLNFVNNFSEINEEIANDIVAEITNNGLTIDAKEQLRNLINNTRSVALNGKRAAGIVSQLLELTRKSSL